MKGEGEVVIKRRELIENRQRGELIQRTGSRGEFIEKIGKGGVELIERTSRGGELNKRTGRGGELIEKTGRGGSNSMKEQVFIVLKTVNGFNI